MRLADALANASRQGTQGIAQHRPVELANRLRDAVVIEAPCELRIPASQLEAGHIRVSIAAEPLAAAGLPSTTVVFEVTLLSSAGSQSLLREERTTTGKEAGAWSDHHFELPDVDPQAELAFTVAFDGPAARAYWGSPTLFPSEGESGPNIILVSIDTLGSKHMSCYGYGRETTPNLDRFAERCVLFDQAISHQNWTLTAHMSLFTSLFPDTHKVNLGTSLPEELPLLPELLRDAGYYTIGRASNPYLMPKWGYGRAYDAFTMELRGTVDDASVELDRLLASPLPEPFFLFVHLIDPHSDWKDLPYDSADEFMPAPPAGGWDSIQTCVNGRCATQYLALVNEGTVTIGPEIEHFEALYDAGIRHTDARLGALFDKLDTRGLIEESLIIVTSDHGEEFLEHGKVMHTQGYDECLRVPLMFKFPGQEHAGLRIPEQVQHVDVMPTIIEFLGLERPKHLEGLSLLPLIEGDSLTDRIAYAKGLNHSMTERDCYVARTEDWKLLWWLEDNRTALYNLRDDPDETRDVSFEESAMHDRLLEALVDHRRIRNTTGFHIRIPPHDTRESLTVVAKTSGQFVRVSQVNPNTERRGPASAVELNGSELSFTTAPRTKEWWKTPVGFDFDIEPEGASIQIQVHANGRMLPASSFYLGSTRAHPVAIPLQITDKLVRDSIGDGGMPISIENSDRPAVYLWESRAGGASVHLTNEEKRALEALGYAGDEDEEEE